MPNTIRISGEAGQRWADRFRRQEQQVWNPQVYNTDIERVQAEARRRIGSPNRIQQSVRIGQDNTTYRPSSRLNIPYINEDAERSNAFSDLQSRRLGGEKLPPRLASGSVRPIGETLIEYAPGTGDALQFGGAISDALKGDYLSAAAGIGLLALPEFIAKPLIGPGKKPRLSAGDSNAGLTPKSEAEILDDLKRIQGLSTNHPDIVGMYDDFKARISTEEGMRRAKALGIDDAELDPGNRIDDTLHNINFLFDSRALGYFDPKKNSAYIHPLIDLKSQTVRHEVEHGVQTAIRRSRKRSADINNTSIAKESNDLGIDMTKIDDVLSGLDLKRSPSQDLSYLSSGLELGDKMITNPNIRTQFSDKQGATNYFVAGSGGKEKSAMLSELHQYMVNKNIIPARSYTEITPEMMEDLYMNILFDEAGGGSYLRILNIMKPTKENFKIISKGLNMMLGTGAAVTVGSELLNDNK